MSKKGYLLEYSQKQKRHSAYEEFGIMSATNYDYNIATLRTLAALLIILIHYSGTFLVGYIRNTEMLNMNFWVANYINGICRISTPMFLFISGHFLLEMKKGVWYFYTSRFKNVFVPSLIATGLYVLYDYYSLHMDSDRILHKLKSGYIFGHMWYMYMLIGLYLVTPPIAFILKKMNKESQIVLGMVMLIAGVSINGYYYFFEKRSYFITGKSFLFWFFPYTGYYILGYAFKDMWFYIVRKRLFLFFIIIMSLNSVLNFMSHKYWDYGFYFFSRTSILVAFGSLIFFLLFRQIIINKPNLLSRFSGYTLGIYLYHAGILDFLNRKLFWKIKSGFFVFDMIYQYALVVFLTVLFVWGMKKLSKALGIQL